MTKAEAVLDAIRKTDVMNELILHNSDMSIWCILKVMAKDMEHDDEEAYIQ